MTAASPYLQIRAAVALDAEIPRFLVRQQLFVRRPVWVVTRAADENLPIARISGRPLVGVRVDLCRLVALAAQRTLCVL